MAHYHRHVAIPYQLAYRLPLSSSGTVRTMNQNI